MTEDYREKLVAEAAQAFRETGTLDLVTLATVATEGWCLDTFTADVAALASIPETEEA